MQTKKILTSLMLYVAIMLPQYTLAASFCTTTAGGKIRVDDCKYGSYDECKRAAGSREDCIVNHEADLPESKVAPYCMVTWSTECKYLDYETCTQAAQKQKGFCYLNPDYKKSDK
jgi:hypothetical protein